MNKIIVLSLLVALGPGSSLVSLPAMAETGVGDAALQTETAAMDNPDSKPQKEEPAVASTPPTVLYGGTAMYDAAVDKLEKGVKLTGEEYRALGCGCLGYETDRTFFQNQARISDVYKDSPADKAGLRVGDILIDDRDNDDEAKAHPDVPLWKVTCGQVGTDYTVQVLRHKKVVSLTLTRMNIEDIKEKNYRQTWEKLISRLGFPKDGSFSGRSLKQLHPVVDNTN